MKEKSRSHTSLNSRQHRASNNKILFLLPLVVTVAIFAIATASSLLTFQLCPAPAAHALGDRA